VYIGLGVREEADEGGDDLQQCRGDHLRHPVVRPANKEHRQSNRSLLGSSIPSSLASELGPRPRRQLHSLIT